MNRGETGLNKGDRPLRRPVGAPRCASTVLVGAIGMGLVLWIAWAMAIYEDTLVGFETGSGLVGSVQLLDAMLVTGLIMGPLGNTLNRGYVWVIRLVNILYSILYYTFLASMFALLMLAIFVRLENFNNLITMLIFWPFVIWTRRSQQSCRWMDLTSSPEEWELPYYAKYRDRVLAARERERQD